MGHVLVCVYEMYLYRTVLYSSSFLRVLETRRCQGAGNISSGKGGPLRRQELYRDCSFGASAGGSRRRPNPDAH